MTDPHEGIPNDDMLININTSFLNDEHMEDVFLESLLNDVIAPLEGPPVLAEDYIVFNATTDSIEGLFDDAMVVLEDGVSIVPLESDPTIDMPIVNDEQHDSEQCRLASLYGPVFPGSLMTSDSTVFVSLSALTKVVHDHSNPKPNQHSVLRNYSLMWYKFAGHRLMLMDKKTELNSYVDHAQVPLSAVNDCPQLRTIVARALPREESLVVGGDHMDSLRGKAGTYAVVLGTVSELYDTMRLERRRMKKGRHDPRVIVKIGSSNDLYSRLTDTLPRDMNKYTKNINLLCARWFERATGKEASKKSQKNCLGGGDPLVRSRNARADAVIGRGETQV